MTDTPTTALTLIDIAPTPTPLTTGASPATIEVGPRLYEITSGGTAGNESVIIPLPDLPVGGSVNASLVGLRITFCLVAQTNPADRTVISVDGNSFLDTSGPTSIYIPEASSVVLSFVGATVSFVWATDAWMIDSAYTDGNFDYNYQDDQTSVFGPAGANANGSGMTASVVASNATAGTNQAGGDVLLTPGTGAESGRNGVVRSSWPTADPHVVNALWNNAGVLTVSAG